MMILTFPCKWDQQNCFKTIVTILSSPKCRLNPPSWVSWIIAYKSEYLGVHNWLPLNRKSSASSGAPFEWLFIKCDGLPQSTTTCGKVFSVVNSHHSFNKSITHATHATWWFWLPINVSLLLLDDFDFQRVLTLEASSTTSSKIVIDKEKFSSLLLDSNLLSFVDGRRVKRIPFLWKL